MIEEMIQIHDDILTLNIQIKGDVWEASKSLVTSENCGAKLKSIVWNSRKQSVQSKNQLNGQVLTVLAD